jgi:hypothetical protein
MPGLASCAGERAGDKTGCILFSGRTKARQRDLGHGVISGILQAPNTIVPVWQRADSRQPRVRAGSRGGEVTIVAPQP